jgi:hypothetical protein
MGSGNTSSAISGFIGYQAQTSYQCDIFANLYLSGQATEWRNNCKSPQENRYDHLFGNAVSSVLPSTELPVMLQYEYAFKLADGSDTQIRTIFPAEYNGLGANERFHYANFGMALYNRYVALGLGGFMARPQDGILDKFQFVGWEAFVLNWKRP